MPWSRREISTYPPWRDRSVGNIFLFVYTKHTLRWTTTHTHTTRLGKEKDFSFSLSSLALSSSIGRRFIPFVKNHLGCLLSMGSGGSRGAWLGRTACLHGSLFLLATLAFGCIGRHLCAVAVVVLIMEEEEIVICIGTVRARHTLLGARGRCGGIGGKTCHKPLISQWKIG